MPSFVKYLSLAFLSLQVALLAQQAEPATEAPVAKPQTAEVEAEKPDAPPEEPVEAPVRKAPRRIRQPQLHRVHHPNAIFGENIVVKKNESIDELVLIGGSAVI